MPVQERQSRPIYMLIFNDYLKRHNEKQPKFQPPSAKPQASGSQRAARPTPTVAIAATVTAKAPKEATIVAPSQSNTETSVPSQVSSSNNTLRTRTKTAGSAQPSSSTQASSVVSRSSYTGSAVQSAAANPSVSVSQPPAAPDVPGAAAAGATWSFNLANNPQIPTAYADHRTSTDFNKTNSMVVRGRDGGRPDRPRSSAPVNRVPPIKASPAARGTAAAAGGGVNSVGVPTMKDSAPSVSQTPAAVMGNSSGAAMPLGPPLQQQQQQQQSQPPKLATINKSPHPPYVSMAKTIAEQTPNAFKTLGPGFNSAAEKSASINSKSGSGASSLASQTMPSDYEHIFHAPSQISDLPSVNTKHVVRSRDKTVVGEKKSSSSRKRHHHRRRYSKTHDGGGGGGT